ncbi:flavodoxin domain-containing protein [Pseudarthrobacter sp. NPDC058329]|uniref:flavodoxin domain-containing protein n=1 Tax=Pseudarthrobacter sp. NPDC058329 TaxID=3346448 RepID=UPI0036DDBF3F
MPVCKESPTSAAAAASARGAEHDQFRYATFPILTCGPLPVFFSQFPQHNSECRGFVFRDCQWLRANSSSPAFSGFDAVIVGASVHMGKHEDYVRDFVQTNRAILEASSSW